MKQTCRKHGDYSDSIFSERCPKCESAEDRGFIYFCMAIFIVLFGIIFGLRYLWAKHVYHDTRCIWAECRIIK